MPRPHHPRRNAEATASKDVRAGGERRVVIYRDDSTVQVVYERVKATFWTAGNTVFVIAQYVKGGPKHRYIHWPRERFCWFKDETNC